MDDLFGGSVRNKVDDLIEVLWLTDGWPRDPIRDRALCRELLRQFPDKDLEDELGQWRVWLATKGKREMVVSSGRYARVRNWCAGRFLRPSRTAPATGSGPRRGGTYPRSPESFGESRVTTW